MIFNIESYSWTELLNIKSRPSRGLQTFSSVLDPLSYVYNICNVLLPNYVNSKECDKVLLDEGIYSSVLWPTVFPQDNFQLETEPSVFWYQTCSLLRYPKADIDGKKEITLEINIFKRRLFDMFFLNDQLENIFINEHSLFFNTINRPLWLLVLKLRSNLLVRF